MGNSSSTIDASTTYCSDNVSDDKLLDGERSSTKISASKYDDYVYENIVPKECTNAHILLRYFLDTHISASFFRKLGKQKKVSYLLDCWFDLSSYRSNYVADPELRFEMAFVLFAKYIQDACLYSLINNSTDETMSSEEFSCRNYFEARKSAMSNSNLTSVVSIFPLYGFDWLQRIVFLRIYDDLYLPFETSHEKVDLLCDAIETSKAPCKVSVKDFVFEKILGEGAFGIVVLCKKTSSGEHYAMKLQEKDEMISQLDGSADVTTECTSLMQCSHPFIMQLHYAFQTENLAIMAMQYFPLGDLGEYTRSMGLTALPYKQVLFYLAELVSAVGYLHSKGFVHRDIKPGNMLLNSDGHMSLADFGSVMSEKDDTLVREEGNLVGANLAKLHKQNSKQNIMKILLDNSTKLTKLFERSNTKDSKYIIAANDIVGTDGYMSPEIGYLASLNPRTKENVLSYYYYTKAVDWWSVGATAYKLLTGKKPMDVLKMRTILTDYEFDGGAGDYVNLLKKLKKDVNPLQAESFDMAESSDPSTNILRMQSEDNNAKYRVPQPIELVLDVETPILMKKFIQSLLDVNFISRLGSGTYGTSNVRSHPVFSSIIWADLENKAIPPPVLPELIKQPMLITQRAASLAFTAKEMVSVIFSPRSKHSGIRTVGARWSESLQEMEKIYKHKSSAVLPEADFHCNFDKLLKKIGKETWLSPLTNRLALPLTKYEYASSKRKKDLFKTWNYTSSDAILADYGFHDNGGVIS